MKVLLFANTDWYLYNFRLPLAEELRRKGHRVILVSPPGSFARRISDAGFEWIGFDFSRAGANPFKELGTLVRLVRLYRTIQPDLVHHFTIKCVLYGSAAARLCGIPKVINAVTGLGHVFTTNSIRNRVLAQLVRAFYRLALRKSHVVFQNPDDLTAFDAMGLVPKAQCHLIRGSGVNVERFRPIERALANEPVRIVMVARLLHEKGVVEFVEAAKLIASNQKNVEFILAGSTDLGNPSSIDDSKLREWEQLPFLSMHGHVEDVAQLLRSAHICVLPSYREGTPRSLLEAAASGLPLVATDVPGCREVVKHGSNGYLVPSKDTKSLAEAIQLLIVDGKLRTVFGKKSRELAVAEFSEHTVLERTIEVYSL